MTVLFDIRDYDWPLDADGCRCPPHAMFVQLANTNALDFFAWIGLPDAQLWGDIPARELTALLRRRLWPERRTHGDGGRPGRILAAVARATWIECERPAGRLAQHAQRLLALAEHARDGVIIWG